MREVHPVTATNTLWVFVSCSHEPRHLYDIIFAVDCLRHRGIADAQILVFVDHPTPGQHLHAYGIEAVFPVTSLGAVLATARAHEHVVVTVAGHGSIVGLGRENAPVRPAALIRATRSVPGIERATLLVTQCFGGIFNLLDASTKPEMVTIGATNLNPSASLGIELNKPLLQRDGSPGIANWSANIFMMGFFSWLRSPTDVDGDGRMTMLDAYKHAGASSNEQLRQAKSGLFLHARKLASDLELARASGALPITLDAIELKLQRALSSLHLHQEAWLLHASLARRIQF
jgi:hypothetical protein